MRRLLAIAMLVAGLALGSSVVQAAHHEAGEAEGQEMPPVEAEPADESDTPPAAPKEGEEKEGMEKDPSGEAQPE